MSLARNRILLFLFLTVALSAIFYIPIAATGSKEGYVFGWNIEVTATYLVISVFILVQATLGVLISCLTALGEEIGWRGFLVPQLASVTSFTKTALISGLIWAVWHYPNHRYGRLR